MRARQVVLTVIGIAALAAACSSGTDDEAAAPSTTGASTSSTTPGEPLTVDWRGEFETPLPNGWTMRSCEGERTNVCIYEGPTFLGDIELLGGYPLSPEDDPAQPKTVALAWARRMIEHFRGDRAEGCADFTFTPIEPREASVGGLPGARGGFDLSDRDGNTVERVINHYVVVDGAITIINTDAYAIDGGCLTPSEIDPSFTPEHLAALDEELLDRIIADSPATAD